MPASTPPANPTPDELTAAILELASKGDWAGVDRLTAMYPDADPATADPEDE